MNRIRGSRGSAGAPGNRGRVLRGSIASTRTTSRSADRFACHPGTTMADDKPAAIREAVKSADTPSAVREAVKALTGVIGWIGASVAGLTALGYGAGYFTVHEHLIMLGFSDVLDVTNDDILLEGGRFFYLTLQQMAVGGIIIVVTATAMSAIAWAINRLPAFRKNKGVIAVNRRMISTGVRSLASELLPLTAIAIVVWHYNAYYEPLSSILSLENLAFSTPRAESGTLAIDVSKMIMSGDANDRAALVDSYNFFVQVYALFIAVTWLMIYNRSSTAFGRAANFLFVIYTVILTAFLPLAFAVLVRTPIYPVANVMLKGGQAIHGLVIQRTDRGMILWNPRTRSAASYGREDVMGYEVVGSQDIFAKE